MFEKLAFVQKYDIISNTERSCEDPIFEGVKEKENRLANEPKHCDKQDKVNRVHSWITRTRGALFHVQG